MLKETFYASMPSHQASLDLFEGGWYSKMPEGSGLVGGQDDAFADGRVPWAAKILGGLAGKTILELGPFEAYNTSQFENLGAASVVAIEGSASNFLKCLTIKNIMGLKTTFLYGDFTKYLEDTKSRVDICWASGVLYHQTQPIEFLKGISQISDTLFVWTHYYDKTIMLTRPDAHIFMTRITKILNTKDDNYYYIGGNIQRSRQKVFSPAVLRLFPTGWNLTIFYTCFDAMVLIESKWV